MKRVLWAGLLVILLLWPASAIFAAEPVLYVDGGRIFVDEDVSLSPGETFQGDIGVFNGDLTVPSGSTVDGDVFLTNGNANIAGRVNGSVAVMSGDFVLEDTGVVQGDAFVMSGDLDCGGQVDGDLSVMFGDLELRSSAVVLGNLTVISGSYQKASGAQVRGEEISDIPLPRIPLLPERLPQPEIPALPEMPEVPRWTPPAPPPSPPLHQDTLGQRIGHFVGRTVTVGFLSVVLMMLGLLMVFLWPRATRRVSDCIAAMPAQSFVLGLLTFLIAFVLEAVAGVLMILIILVAAVLIGTVILIPFGLLLILLSVLILLPVPLALVGAVLLGWVGLAERIGQRVLRMLGVHGVTPLGAVLAGLLVTVPLAGILWILSPACCAWPFVILLTSVGVGAVIHTRFGTQICRQNNSSASADVLPAEAMDEEIGQADSPWTQVS
jgi:hypothetical protein